MDSKRLAKDPKQGRDSTMLEDTKKKAKRKAIKTTDRDHVTGNTDRFENEAAKYFRGFRNQFN